MPESFTWRESSYLVINWQSFPIKNEELAYDLCPPALESVWKVLVDQSMPHHGGEKVAEQRTCG